MNDPNRHDLPRQWNAQIINTRIRNPQPNPQRGGVNLGRRNNPQPQQNNPPPQNIPPPQNVPQQPQVDYQALVTAALNKFSNDLSGARGIKTSFEKQGIFTQEWKEFEAAYQQVIVGRNLNQYDQALLDKVKLLRVKTNVLLDAFARLKRQVELTKAPAMKQLASFKEKAFAVGGAQELAGRKDLEAGGEFKKFIVALAKVEKGKTLPNIEALENAANNYLNHAEHKQSAPTEHRDKKKMQCERALEHAKLLRMALEYETLGRPPWDLAAESKAGEIRAVTIFETGGEAKQLGVNEAGTSGSWFVETKAYRAEENKGEEPTGKSLFIFKPIDAEDEYEAGWEKEGGAIREIATKQMSDHVQAMTGIDLGISPSYLVKISNDKLPDNGNVDPNKPPQRIGVMQQLAPNDGDLQKVFDTTRQGYDPVAAQQFEQDLAQVPPEELGKVVWADFLSMNHDRHGGNVLIDRTNKKLIPIDHGKCMPPSLHTAIVYRNEIDQKNIINKLAAEGRLPQANQKLPDDMIEQIQLHDPMAMAQHIKTQRDKLKQGTPEDKEAAEKLSDDAIDLSARSAYFFKHACRELTVRQLAQAQSRFLYIVLAADPNDLDQACADAIEKTRAASAAETELARRNPEILQNNLTNLKALVDPLGWSGKYVDELLALNPGLLLKIIDNQLVEPGLQRAITAATEGLQALQVPLPNGLDTMTPADRKSALTETLSDARRQAISQTAAGLGFDLERTAELQNLQQQLQQVNNGPLAVNQQRATDTHQLAQTNLENANDNNRADLQKALELAKQELDSAVEALRTARAPITKAIEQINRENGEAKANAETYLDWGGDAKLVQLGKIPATLTGAERIKACEEAMTDEFNRLGGKVELEKAKAYGKILMRTPKESLTFLKAWIEFRDTALPNNTMYKLGWAPLKGSNITNNLQEFKTERANRQLYANH